MLERGPSLTKYSEPVARDLSLAESGLPRGAAPPVDQIVLHRSHREKFLQERRGMVGCRHVVDASQKLVVRIEPPLLVRGECVAFDGAIVIEALPLHDVIGLFGGHIVEPPRIRVPLHVVRDSRGDETDLVIGLQAGEVGDQARRLRNNVPWPWLMAAR